MLPLVPGDERYGTVTGHSWGDRMSQMSDGVAGVEVADRYERIAVGFTWRVEGLTSGQWSLPTPCKEWSAADIVTHVIGVHRLILTMLDGGDVEAVAAGADLLATWRETSALMLGALRDRARATKVIVTPFGEMPFEDLVSRVVCSDTLVHTWDLALRARTSSSIPRRWSSRGRGWNPLESGCARRATSSRCRAASWGRSSDAVAVLPRAGRATPAARLADCPASRVNLKSRVPWLLLSADRNLVGAAQLAQEFRLGCSNSPSARSERGRRMRPNLGLPPSLSSHFLDFFMASDLRKRAFDSQARLERSA